MQDLGRREAKARARLRAADTALDPIVEADDYGLLDPADTEARTIEHREAARELRRIAAARMAVERRATPARVAFNLYTFGTTTELGPGGSLLGLPEPQNRTVTVRVAKPSPGSGQSRASRVLI